VVKFSFGLLDIDVTEIAGNLVPACAAFAGWSSLMDKIKR